MFPKYLGATLVTIAMVTIIHTVFGTNQTLLMTYAIFGVVTLIYLEIKDWKRHG